MVTSLETLKPMNNSQAVNTGDIEIRIDNRIRLMSAVLAVTDYPEKAQQAKPHGTHAHARATRKHLAEHSKHPIVQLTQIMLDKNVPVEALFTATQALDPQTFSAQTPLPDWLPRDWDAALRDFYTRAALAEWWSNEHFVWDKSEKETRKVFSGVSFKQFLHPYFGDIAEQFIFMPNLAFPSDREIGIRYNQELICITPPPLAWGDSPPWPYDEDTMLMHSYRATLVQYGRILLMSYLRANPEQVKSASESPLPVNDQFRAQFPSWEEQFTELFVNALVAMYLEEFVSEAEYKAFVLIEKKVRGMNILPGTVSVMRRYLQERGNKYNTLMEFLPLFPKQLRVAKRIVTL